MSAIDDVKASKRKCKRNRDQWKARAVSATNALRKIASHEIAFGDPLAERELRAYEQVKKIARDAVIELDGK